MSEKKIKTRIQQKHDTEANWYAAGRGRNPFIPMIGELIIYDIDDNYHYTKGGGKCTIGIAICSIDVRRKGYATSALKTFIYYLMSKGIYEIYTYGRYAF